MKTVTLTRTDSPSRSKQAGPCWIAIKHYSHYTFASPTEIAIDFPDGETIEIVGKANLRRASGRSDITYRTWTAVVTGNPDDTITVRVGTPQAVEAVLTGVKSTDS